MRRALILLAGSIALSACAATASREAPSVMSNSGAPEKPAFRLSQIEAKSASDLDALLGEPDLVRKEGRGEFRRYSLASCALLVVLYPDETGVRRVRSIAAGALNSSDEKPDPERCLALGKAKAA